MADKPDTITVNNLGLGGFAPAYWTNDYPIYGNKNQAADMENVDLMTPHGIGQGPGLSTLTNGTDSGAVTTNIHSIMRLAESADTTYAVGGDQVYKLSSTTVTNDTDWPHTITGTSPVGEDITEYAGDIYYSHNDSGTGYIGKLTLPNTFDGNWSNNVPSGATTLADAPHPLHVAGTSGLLAFGNGYKVGTYDGTTLYPDTFSTHDSDSVVVDLKWARNNFYIAANKPNLSGSNRVKGTVYIWDGYSKTWSNSVDGMNGPVGALYVKNSRVYIWYKDEPGGECIFGYINGDVPQPLAHYEGELPDYNQVTEKGGFFMWESGQDIYAFGAASRDLNARLFHYAKADYATGGALANPFGEVLVCSTDTTNYKLSKFSGYSTSGYWKSITYPVASVLRKSTIDKIVVKTDPIPTNGQINVDIVDSGGSSLLGSKLNLTDDGEVIHSRDLGTSAKDFRVEFDWSNADTSSDSSIRGYTLTIT